MYYLLEEKVVSAFKYTGNLMDNKGKWIVPDWAVYLYQKGNLYFYARKPFLPPTELYYKKDENSKPIHIKVGDYVVNMDDYRDLYPNKDDIYIINEELFKALFKEA